jgi:hypothetical protein
VPGGAYVVTKRLPERNGEFEYQIKSVNEPHERVVRESQLETDLWPLVRPNRHPTALPLTAILRASTVKVITSHTGNSHTDNRCCNIDTGTPTHRCGHNRNCRNDTSPVLHELGGGGSTAFSRTMPVAATEPLYAGFHSQATKPQHLE